MTSAVQFLAQWALLVSLGWLAVGCAERPPLVRLAQAHLVGTSLLALSLHALLAAGVEAPPVWLPGALAVALSLSLFSFRRVGRAPPVGPEPALNARPECPPWPAWLLWLLRVMLLLGLLTLAARLALLPLDWDGWAIWAMKAKALSQGNLRDLLSDPSYYYSHQDYPLLVPAHSWWLSGGGFTEKAAQAGGMLFALDLLVMLYHHLRRRGEGPALAGCVLLVSIAPFAKHSASGFADVPMAAYALATCLALREGRALDLAVCLIGALLTKNEGLFALAAVSAAALLSPTLLGARGGRLIPLLAAGVGLALAVLPWMWVKRQWGAGADLLDPSQWVMGEMAGRLWVIAQGFARQAIAMGPQYPGWGFLWPALLVAAVFAFRNRQRATAVLWLFLLTFMAGAVTAYLVTPLDPALHLDRSVDRLWLHLAPIAVLAVAESLLPTVKNSPSTE